jgi:hypothetical protein
MLPEVVVTVTVRSADCPAAPEIVKSQVPAPSGVTWKAPVEPLVGEMLAVSEQIGWTGVALKVLA